MNTQLNATKILCYGDSNTWGYVPKSKSRYPVHTRWTGQLQVRLGPDYWVIEEGLNSRTTDLEDPTKSGRNGLTFLRPCLESHNPIDIVVMMLGTNDMKERFHREPADIAKAIERLINEIKATALNQNSETPQILLVSPPFVDGSVEGVNEKYRGADEKSHQLAPLYEQIARKHSLEFLDIALYVQPSKKDGYHFEPDGHSTMAQVVFEKIMAMKASTQ